MTTAGRDLAGLAGLADAAQAGRAIPPVHLWNPPDCGEIDIRIASDGRWFHDGALITRERLVRLFSTILRRDPDGYYLVTPVEKLRITVEDAPFLAVAVDRVGEAIRFSTSVGDVVDAGPEHALRMDLRPAPSGSAPYVDVRRGLRARLSRPVYYALAELGEVRPTPGGDQFGVESLGVWFPLGALEAADA